MSDNAWERKRLLEVEVARREAQIDRLRAEIERLRAGGCARDQNTTQYCAEASRLAAENEKLRAMVVEAAQLSAENAQLRAERLTETLQFDVSRLSAENERLRAEVERLSSVLRAWQSRAANAEIKAEKLAAENERLRAALREAYEIYANSDGFIPETAAEGYQQHIIKQMVDCIAAAIR